MQLPYTKEPFFDLRAAYGVPCPTMIFTAGDRGAA